MDVILINQHKRLPKEAGGKARGLQQIIKAGLQVPTAWVVLPGASNDSITRLQEDIKKRNIHILAARSSSAEEDAEQHSFAGIHESLLALTVEQLPEAIKQVSSSTLSERATAYRKEMGLPPSSGPCAVIVQEMIAGECSGIAFGGGSATKTVSIEAVEGLGKTAVDGLAVPEMLSLYLTDGRWRIQQRMRRTQPVAFRIREGQMVRFETEEDWQHAYVLDESVASRIAADAFTLETTAGQPLDIEWTCTADNVWYLQARPQSRPLHDALPAGETWTRINAREVLPEIPSAFSRSLFVTPFDKAERRILQSYGISVDTSIPFTTSVYGRPVFNERVYTLADLLGVDRKFIQAEFGGNDTAESIIKPLDFRKLLRHPVIMIRAILISLQVERQAIRYLDRLEKYSKEIESIDIKAADHEKLFDVIEWASDAIVYPFVFHSVRIAGQAGNAQFHLLWQLQGLKLAEMFPWAVLSKLVAGGEPSVSTRQIDALVSLAETFHNWPGHLEFAGQISPEHALAQYWRDRLPALVWEQVENWLENFGHRGPYESDLARPRYRDDLRVLARALFPLISHETLDHASSRQKQRQEEADRTWNEISASCGFIRRNLMKARLQEVKKLLALRELNRSNTMKTTASLRNILMELGRRLQRDNRLRSQDDIWHLSFREIKHAFRNPELDIKITVKREHSRLAAWRRISIPNRFTSEDILSLTSDNIQDPIRQTVFRGNGISPGIVEGKAAVLRSPSEHAFFPSGSILVAPATDPAWTPIFARASGIVVEIGGALSHAGIVAREYGIPCVANIPEVTRTLKDGDLIRLDGASGVVTKLEDN